MSSRNSPSLAYRSLMALVITALLATLFGNLGWGTIFFWCLVICICYAGVKFRRAMLGGFRLKPTKRSIGLRVRLKRHTKPSRNGKPRSKQPVTP